MAVFSKIYVEESCANHPQTLKILDNFPNLEVIHIPHFKDVFNRSGQNWRVQKEHQALILAVKKDQFFYKGSDYTPDFGHGEFYYNAVMLNCIYDCDYCYLQGLFPSAHVVVFVNQDEFKLQIQKEIERIDAPIYLALSYDTDLLAFENLFGFTAPWLDFIEKEKRLSVEIRTKSANVKWLKNYKPNNRTVFAWSLSPQDIIENHEKKTASLKARIHALNSTMEMGWPVRICIDPMLRVKNWEIIYKKFFDFILKEIDFDKVKDLSIGTFRMNHDFLKRMRKQRKDTLVLFDDYQVQDGSLTYQEEIVEAMYDIVRKSFKSAHSKERIHFI